MSKGRLEAFSDGVIAILITIMVLELKVPHGADWETIRELGPIFFSYVLSFVYLGIYWNNHHHMLHASKRVNGAILWANLHLLFWLSLIPFTTGWVAENHAAPLPVALYGVNLLLAGGAYKLLQDAIIRADGNSSKLASAVGADWKAKVSIGAYSAAIALAFYQRWVSIALYVAVAAMWLVPDPRIERQLNEE